MVTNYYTLLAVTNEIRRIFRNRSIDTIFTQHRGELVITFSEDPSVLIIGCEPSYNYFYSRASFSRARKNSVNLLNSAHGQKITDILIQNNDREIRLLLENDTKIVVQLYGSKANVLVVSNDGIIIDAFLNKDSIMNRQFSDTGYHQGMVSKETFVSLLKNVQEDQNLNSSLKLNLPTFGPVLILEALTRSGLNGFTKTLQLVDDDIERLWENIEQVHSELIDIPKPRIYFDRTIPIQLSIIPLHHLSELTYQSFDSVSDAVMTFKSLSQKSKSTVSQKELLQRGIEKELRQAERTIKKISDETISIEQAERYEHYGKLLMAHIHLLQKGEMEAILDDVLHNSKELITIPLDSHLTPAKNAERYFQKARKSRSTIEEQRTRKTELAQRCKLLEQLESDVEQVTTDEEMQTFLRDHASTLSAIGIQLTKIRLRKKEEPIPFRVFRVTGGFQVWAGKSGENNDLLTIRYTAKNDLWFHARGASGSHVTLKVGTGKGEVSKRAIEQAAAIAAYYSKMKHSKLVPVTMCEGKYVHKSKNSPVGTVTVEREKTIFVEPLLPDPIDGH